jgi:hypothetical protein
VTARASFALVASLAAAGAARAEEAPLQRFLRDVVVLDAAQAAALERGDVVTKRLPSSDRSEVAVFGIVRVPGDVERLPGLARDVRSFRKGPRTAAIGVFGTPPAAADLAGLTLPPEDVAALRRCRPGACDVKIGTAGLRLLSQVDWSAPDADARASAVLVQGIVDYVSAYQRGGTGALGDLLDKKDARSRAAEHRAVLAASPYLFEHVRALADALAAYPRQPLAGATNAFYWTKDTAGPKPVVSVYHSIVLRGPRGVLIADRLLGSTHFFNAALDVTAAVPAEGGGLYLVTTYRTRLDPPTGPLASALMGKVRDGIEAGVRQNLETARARLAVAR